jgi:DNA mismatch endonuclease (patch repair protein)
MEAIQPKSYREGNHVKRVDVLNTEQRAYCMSRIRGRDTEPELRFRKALWALGIRYRIKNRLIGRPDIVIVRARIAIFIDGCFWHRCPTHFTAPRTRKMFWKKKIDANRRRDRTVNHLLRRDGWTVVRIWEHEIKKNLERACDRVIRFLISG